MVTIENLEVQFDVSGDGDEQVFARYFARFIEQWWQDREQDKMLERRLRSDQMLGDVQDKGAY
jgi:hypothetical protein